MGAPPNIVGDTTGNVLSFPGDPITGVLDEDANGSADTWSIEVQGTYGVASIDGNGEWTYDLDETNATVDDLAPGEELEDIFQVRVDDVWGTDFQNITITITGAPCLVLGTLVDTPSGPRPVESLATGDLVATRDHGYQPLIWVGQRVIGEAELAEDSRKRPVRIAAGALGAGLPRRDLLVSRQHRMLVSSEIARQMFGTQDVLIPAHRLVGLPGVSVEDATGPVTYVHLLFDRHQVIFAEGAPTESLLLVPGALAAWPQAQAEELRVLMTQSGGGDMIPAAPIPEPKKQKALIGAHRAQGAALLECGSREQRLSA